MDSEQQRLEDVSTFLRQHRNNENNFEKIYEKLEEEYNNEYGEALQFYKEGLQELKEKEVVAYHQMKKAGGTAYPEFEKVASGFEKMVSAAIKELNKTDE